MATSGSLSPEDAAYETLEVGEHHLHEPLKMTLAKNFYGGLLLSAAGQLAMLLSKGIPGYSKANPGLSLMLQGTAFPVGLIIVYALGAELFTGYPMWFCMTAIDRKGKPWQYVMTIIMSLGGNFAGALFWSGVQSYFTQSVTEEPWRSSIIEQIDSSITDEDWHVIFLRAIGCGFLVSIAMMLGTQNRDGISKALGLWLPFFISTVSEFPHTVEYMYLGLTAMMLGARLSVGLFLWKCILPVILGNIVGGAFVGGYNYLVFVKRGDDKQTGQRRDWLPATADD
ncbi:hypothetical protein LTR78_005196 [Recurvomyces mirabilis]|uniref:Formate/nitrite transporter n=1 Tax=Recurvomyces mirabilis TaxID=574656 RepID=A0AAE0WNB4_9PEZI|nr:hypothetical protein LTR78_005196 [Recurvomyces mirabilis]KAK5157746.1 hypothetical protein LTS14_003668 [Recurvomyces mirabilis]